MQLWMKWGAAVLTFCLITYLLSAFTQAHYLVVMAAALIGGACWFREELDAMQAESRRMHEAREDLKKAEIIREHEAQRRLEKDRELAKGLPQKK